MTVFKTRNVLSGMLVSEVMHKHLTSLPAETVLKDCIRHLYRTKTNAVLLEDNNGIPAGVISKTDMIMAFYSGIDVESKAEEMMNYPVSCGEKDTIEAVLELIGKPRDSPGLCSV